MFCEILTRISTMGRPLTGLNLIMLSKVVLICICFCITIFGNVGSAQDDVYASQPKIITQNGHLIFMSSDNHNITFKSQGLGAIRINDDDLSEVVSSAKRSVSDLRRIKDEEIITMRQSIAQLQNQLSNFNELNSRITNIETSMSGFSQSVTQRTNATRMQNRQLNRLRQRVQRLKTRLDTMETLINKNECVSNPCRNGGTCIDGFNGFTCRCPSNWEGPMCEEDFNECVFYTGTDLGCQNGGTCVNTFGGFSCQCPPDHYGIRCTEKHDDCSYSTNQGNLCGHGTCINQQRSQPGQPRYTCICDDGWKTDGVNPACVVDVDECQSGGSHCSQHPMVQCINLPGSFACGPCPAGYIGSGFTCEDINECMSNNGGCSVSPFVQCINTRGSRQCGPCPTGFQGNGEVCVHSGLCGINNGGCHPLATCIENPAISSSYRQCQCPPGYVGSGYGPQGCFSTGVTPVVGSDPCNPNPCVIGTCVTLSTYDFRCNCPLGYTGQRCELSVSHCSSRPCRNGGTCVDQANGYSCTCLSQFTGVNCEQEEDACGGHLNEANGTFRYPTNTNATYPHDKSCAWVITVSPNHVLNITFPEFHLEHTSNCEYDFLEFHDGNSYGAHVLGRFCGNQAPNGGNIITTHNSVYVWFHSDSSLAYAGFRVNWRSINAVCGGEINPPADHGSIKSPGYPGRYPMNRDCIWIVRVPLGKRIQFTFPIFQIEHHDNCNYDYLEIRDGASETDPVLSTICDTRPIPPLLSSGSFARLHFHSDSSLNAQGFVISFNSLPGVPGCGGLLTRDQGSFSSPDHPNQYQHGLECDWLIRVKPDERIKLIFTSMDLESSTRCIFDYVEIYDGSDDTSPLVGRYCGSNMPPTRVSSTNVYFVKFFSDVSIARGGFRATYEIACGGYFTSEQGTFHSPNYPDHYSHSKECVYVIHLPPGKAIQLWFEAFDIEGPSSVCNYDYVEVFDGESSMSPSLGKFCGTQIPEVILSTHNMLYLKFVTDAFIRNRGFLANYTAIDLACGGIYLNETSGIIASPSSTDVLMFNLTCRWIIRPPSGFLVRLEFTALTLSMSRNCMSDYVAVYDNVTTEDNHRLMGRFCGSRMPPLLTSSDNLLYVTFHSDILSYVSFSARFSAFDGSTTCGGNYYSTMGVIQSPSYPNFYPNGRDCTWTIHVQNGQQILLNVTQFTLEPSQECRYDFLEIRNGGYMTSPLIGRYCGMQIPPLIPSHSNQMYLKFGSDHSVRAPGFRISWDGTATGCGGELVSSEGSISSPGYPVGCSSNAECSWRITVNRGNRVRMIFTELDLAMSPNCNSGVQIFDGGSARSTELGRFCGTQVVDPVTSTGNEVFIKFRCSNYSNKRGFHLSYSTVCNTTLSGRRGVIETPNFPNSYPHNRNCTWLINALPGAKLAMTFSILRLEHAANCTYDYVEIKEATYRNTTTIGKFCGIQESPPMIFSTTNQVRVNFASDFLYADNGFALEWVTTGCGGTLTKRSGNFSSPNYPSHYPPNVVCEWDIRVDYGQSIELTFHEYDIESSVGCVYDSIKVYRSTDTTAPFSLITPLCHAQSNPVVVTSHDNELYVVFKSDISVLSKGFTASYVTKSGGCGGRFSVPTGVIHSRNYPNPYDAQDDCTWLVSVEKGHTVFLNFTDFEVRADGNCSAVYLAVYDGPTENDTLLMKHCGMQLPVPSNYSSTSNEVLIRFRGHETLTGRGFHLNYLTGCGATLYADEPGEITVSNYMYNLKTSPNSYSWSPRNCTWIIRARQLEDKVALTITSLLLFFARFSLWPNQAGPCLSHYINIYDGERNDSDLLDHLCRNNSAPPTYVSRGNSLRVLFNGVLNRIQFRAVYYEASSACGGELRSLQGRFTSPEYPSSYPVEIECVWTIATSPGNRVMVAFSSFNLEESEYCNKDYVEIREANSYGPLLGRYCGTETPALNFTAKNQLWVKFRSDIDSVNGGFVASYNMLHGSFLTGTSGQIANPLYPSRAPPVDGKIEWTITVPYHRVVGITFITARFPFSPPTCHIGLKIYDGPDSTARLLGDICGSSIPDPVVSSTNVVYITLTSPRWSSSNIKFLLNWNATDYQYSSALPPPLSISNVTGCSGTFFINGSDVRGSPVMLQSPGFPNGYQRNLHCEWFIYAPVSMSIAISFNSLDVEDAYNCYADAVTLWGVGAVPGQWESLGRFCRRSTASASQIVSYGNAMKVNFDTDSSVNRTGFSAHVYPVCGSNVTASAGVIQSFGYPQNYFNRLKCDWLITVRPGRRIQLHFNQFQLEGNMPACANDYLILRNGMSSNSPVIGSGKYCGSSRPEAIETIGNHLYVQFVSNDVVTAAGFQFSFSEVSSACGGVIMLGDSNPSTQIQTPNHPASYLYLTDCTWRVIAPIRRRIQLHFEGSVDIPSSNGCQADFVVVHDGGSRHSHLLEQYCGHHQNLSTIQSSSNSMYIEFSSSSHELSSGFRATVSLGDCGGAIIGDEGSITSPNYPNNYPANLNCEWMVRGPPGHFLVMKFTVLQTFVGNPDCSASDFVEIRDSNATGPLLGKFCGSNTSTIVQSADNVVYIRFSTRRSTSLTSLYKGFILYFNRSSEECGGEFTTPTGIITSPNFPRPYPVHRVCKWTIRAIRGRKVRLTFTHFNVDNENHERCGGLNSLRPYNDDTDSSIPPYSLCGNRIPDPVLSSSNVLKLVFYAGDRVTGTGFRAAYDTDLEWDCGGDLPLPIGNLTSPGYGVSNYSDHTVCTWSLDNPQRNSTFVFRVHDFLLEESGSFGCKFDAFEIIAGSDKLISSLCGRVASDSVLAVPFSQLQLIFRTDVSVVHSGFSMSYSTSNCGGEVPETGATLSSPNYPSPYPTDIHCAWAVSFPEGQQVQITFEDFQLESSTNCTSAFVIVRNGLSLQSPIIGRYCGADRPQEIRTQVHEAFIEFHVNSLSSSSNRGFRLSVFPVTSGCGGVFHSGSGLLTSVGFPNHYPNDIECEWIFEAEPGYYINVTFVERFDIEMDPSCSKDFIQGFNAVNHMWNSIGRKCGRDLPPPFVSKNNKFRLLFRSNGGIYGDGFKANWTKVCGGVFTEAEASFESGGYPNRYLNNLNCNYLIAANPGDYVVVTFDETFQLEEHPECEYDVVEVYAGNSTAAPLLSRTCGNVAPPSTTHLGPVLIRFVTDITGTYSGFRVSYRVSECGGILRGPDGVISSPLHPSTYHAHMSCSWTVIAPPDRVISFKFLWLDLEGSGQSCYYDYVEVYDGNSTMLGTYCGNTLPPSSRSTTNMVTIEFTTDYTVQLTGFRLAYRFTYGESSGCGGLLNSTSGSIQSVDVDQDGKYEPGLDCPWLISAAEFKAIQINFETFNVENPESAGARCVWDYLEIRDGMGPDSPLISRFCGSEIPAPITSSSNNLWLKFITDDSVNLPGFRATYTVVDPECGGILNATTETQTIESPGYPGNYRVNLRCHWIIYNPSYTSVGVRLRFEELKLENSSSCQKDYLLIEPEVPSYYYYYYSAGGLRDSRRYCGSSVPGVWQASYSTKVHVKFGSDSDQTDKGFKLSFSLSQCNNMTYTDLSGIISEPHFNSSDANNVCVERIAVDAGMTITLNFLRFYIQYSENCYQSYLEVRDGVNESAPLLGRICGYQIPSPFFSTTNNLWLKLNSSNPNNLEAVYFASNDGPGCGGKLNVNAGIITSPYYPGNYSRDSICKWEVTVSNSHSIEVHFYEVQIYSEGTEGNCTTNYLEIYDGTDIDDSHRLGTYCGGQLRASIYTTSNSMILKYFTDTSNSGQGFKIAFNGRANQGEQPVPDVEKP